MLIAMRAALFESVVLVCKPFQELTQAERR